MVAERSVPSVHFRSDKERSLSTLHFGLFQAGQDCRRGSGPWLRGSYLLVAEGERILIQVADHDADEGGA